MHSLSLFTALAVILLAALIGGRIAARMRLPRVTGYLFAGLLTGPSLAHLAGWPELLSAEALNELQVVGSLALAVIMVNIGGQFRTDQLRRYRRRIAFFSVCENLTTFACVALGALVVNLALLRLEVGNLGLAGTSFALALLLGLIAMATAPAATLMVVREYEASGPVTNTLLTLIGLNNLASVILFLIAEHMIVHGGHDLSLLAHLLFAPILIGALIGFVISVWAQKLEQVTEYKVLLLGGVATSVALCHALGVDSLLASLVLGIVLANSSPRWHRLAEALRQVDYPLYVIFFVLAGANLHLDTLVQIGLLGLVYVLMRVIGKLAGAWLGARIGEFGPQHRRWIGMALMAQAGVAIGLAEGLASAWPEGGRLVQTVVLGAVVLFEIGGPLAVRYGLVHSGEVPLLSLLSKQAPQGTLEGLHSVVHHFRAALGLPAGHRVDHPGDILARHIMRRNVETIHNDTGYHELLRLVAHSSYDRFPVVDRQERFIGMIDYTEIRSLLFEPDLARLVVASDLVSTTDLIVTPDQPLRKVLELFHRHRDVSYVPVVAEEDPQRLLGILSQNDVLAAFRRLAEDA